MLELAPGSTIVNDWYTTETAEATLVRGEADMVCFGFPFPANPDLVERFRAGLPLNAPDGSTFHGGDERGYTDYPPFDLVLGEMRPPEQPAGNCSVVRALTPV